MNPIADTTNKPPKIAQKIALILRENRWTYHQLQESAHHIAANLLADGFKPGDRILICLENGFEIVASILACFKVGLIIVQSYVDYSEAELEYIAENSGFRGIITSLALYPKMRRVGEMHAVYLTGLDERRGKLCPFSYLLRKAPLNAPSIDLDQPILISYTSGTTAKRKGVIHTYRSILRTMESILESFGLAVFERPLILSSMGNNGVIMVFMLPAFWLNGTLILAADGKAETILDVIQNERPTFLFSFPFFLKHMIHLTQAKKTDFTSLKLVIVGGDIVTREMCEDFLKVAKIPLRQGFGMTESHCVFANLSDDPSKLGSLGTPCHDVEVKIVDSKGKECPPGTLGELVIRREANTPGYWNFPEETAKALRGGWLHTGDLAVKDRDGFYWFRGRIKNIIIRDAENISPIEVEEALCRHPAVQGAGVVGIPDDEWGQAVKAFVELKPKMKTTKEELQDFLIDLLSPYKIPSEIVFVPKLPRTLTGKIDRKALENGFNH